MSEMSKEARSKAKSKVARLVRPNKGAIDASGWTEPLGEAGGTQTGPRPISRRQFKSGGRISGGNTAMRADRKPRNAGGALTADSLINRDVKKANEEREGPKHVGGMKRGGRAHKEMGGLALPSWADSVSRKSGGRTGKFAGGPMMGRPELPGRSMSGAPGVATPIAARPPMMRPGMPRPELQRGMLRKSGGRAMHSAGCVCAKCAGGAVGKARGGELKNEFGANQALAAQRPTPMNARVGNSGKMQNEQSMNAALERMAKAPRTTRKAGGSVTDGSLEGTRPAGGRLARKGGGRAKKGMNVNIIIAPSSTHPPLPAPGVAPPPGGPVGLHQAPPPPPAMAPPGAAPPMGPAMGMPRKSGGRAYPIESGAGGGLGRLEKPRAYGP